MSRVSCIENLRLAELANLDRTYDLGLWGRNNEEQQLKGPMIA